MRRLINIIITLSLIALCFNIYALSNSTNWMKGINGDKYISEIAIPGTHDSGTSELQYNLFAQTQYLSIPEQLNAGVRMLDIRLRNYNDALVVHHGSLYCHLNFDDVLKDCINFLIKNPSECILMSVKEEYKSHDAQLTFAQAFMKYAQKYNKYLCLNTNIPQLKDIQGKIVLLRRFSCDGLENNIGLNTSFSDNTTFVTDMGKNQFLYGEDLYSTSADDKKEAILKHINKAIITAGINNNNNNLFITFTSGYNLIPFPNLYSRIINPWLNDILQKIKNNIMLENKNIGILMLDFIDDDLSNKIYSLNLDTYLL